MNSSSSSSSGVGNTTSSNDETPKTRHCHHSRSSTKSRSRSRHLLGLKYSVTTRKLGGGSSSEVYFGHRISDRLPVAIKIIPLRMSRHSKRYSQVLCELGVMHELSSQHPNLVQLYDFEARRERRDKKHSQDPSSSPSRRSDSVPVRLKGVCLWLYLEFCGGGDLQSYLTRHRGRISPESCQKFLREIAAGYKQLRSHNVVHRDIKLENIFLTEDFRCKIGDFGLAKRLVDVQHDVMSTDCGTPLFLAPERLINPPGTPYDSRSDLWSIGVVFYQLVYGKYPYFARSQGELAAKYFRKDPILFERGKISAIGMDLLQRLLKADPDERIGFEEFFDHPYFKTYDAAREAARSAMPRPSVLCDDSDSEESEEEESESD